MARYKFLYCIVLYCKKITGYPDIPEQCPLKFVVCVCH